MAGIGLGVGGWDARYSALAVSRWDLFLDLALRPFFKLHAQLPLGYAYFNGDESDDERGWYLGNVIGGGRLIGAFPVGAAEVDLAGGVGFMVPTARGAGEAIQPVARQLFDLRGPRELEGELAVLSLDGSARLAWPRAFVQLDAAVVTVIEDVGPEVDIFHFTLGGGLRFAAGRGDRRRLDARPDDPGRLLLPSSGRGRRDHDRGLLGAAVVALRLSPLQTGGFWAPGSRLQAPARAESPVRPVACSL